MTSRKIIEAPLEVGEDEVVPYTLTIPSTWGTPTSPAAIVKDSDGATVSGGISGSVTVVSSVISFTVDGTVLTVNTDYRVEVQFSVAGGTLEAWGPLLCRQ